MVQEIEFSVDGSTCRALYFHPESQRWDEQNKVPCVVMAHGFGLVREACLPAYAERFADAGLATLIFDYRHFGASEGEPRQLLSIPSQLRDWQAAVTFSRTLDEVNPARIVLFGTSILRRPCRRGCRQRR